MIKKTIIQIFILLFLLSSVIISSGTEQVFSILTFNNYVVAGATYPTVTTSSIGSSSVWDVNVTLNGIITDTGGSDPGQRGFFYGTSNPPSSYAFDSGSFGTGAFTKEVASLNRGTYYYYRATANNSGGYGNGSVNTFLTKPAQLSAFSGLVYSSSQINLTWTHGTGGDKVYIEYSTSNPATWNVGTGTVVPGGSSGVFTGTTASHSGINTENHYYYKAWSIATDGGQDSDNTNQYPYGNATTTDVSGVKTLSLLTFGNTLNVANQKPTISNPTIANGTADVDKNTAYWNCTINDGNGDKMTWTLQCNNNNISSGSGAGNGTISLPVQLNFTEGYIVWVNVTDGYEYAREWFTFHTAKDVTAPSVVVLSFHNYINLQTSYPVLTVPYPSNSSTGVEAYPLLSITATDYDNNLNNVSFYSNASGTWQLIGYNSSTVLANGNYSQRFLKGNTSLTKYWWSVNASDSTNKWTNETYHFTIKYYSWGGYSDYWNFVVANFTNPVNFTARNYNDTGINLTWEKHTNASHTYIRRKADSYPASLTDGELVVNTTLNYYNNSNLNPGTHYYYKAWAYLNISNVFLTTNSTTSNYTNPGNPSYLHQNSNGTTSITLGWNKGTNATNTVLCYSDWDYPAYPNANNTAYNNTGSSCTVSGLVIETKYYFSAWSFNPSSGNFSMSNTTVNASTVSSAGSPTGLTADTRNDTIITLNWTKGNPGDYTVITRNTTGYSVNVGDGLIIYNNTGVTFNDSILVPATHYYYKVWEWNGETYSSGTSIDNNITLPSSPTSLVGNIDGTQLTITWTKGTGATRTIIRNYSTGYPAVITDGTLVYNGTANTTTVLGVTGIDYYSGFSYTIVDGVTLYSIPSHLLWGGLEINVYSENNPSQEVANFTVFITNTSGSETYNKLDCNNPTRISIDDIPQGIETAIIISATGYYSRTYYRDVYPNQFYVLNVYLPTKEGEVPEVPEGGTTPETPTENASLYLITVQSDINQPLQDVKVEFKAYVNTTDSYEIISTQYTDGNGQISIYLLPKLYKVTLSKIDFITSTEDFLPNPLIPTKTFILKSVEEVPVTPTPIVFTATRIETNITIYYYDEMSGTINTRIYIYWINESGVRFANYTFSNTSINLIDYVYNADVNISYDYAIVLFYNHTYYSSSTREILIPKATTGLMPITPGTDTTKFDTLVNIIFGPAGPFIWSNLIMFLFFAVAMFHADKKDVGKYLIFIGGIFIFVSIVGFSTTMTRVANGILPALFIIIGILVEWNNSRRYK